MRIILSLFTLKKSVSKAVMLFLCASLITGCFCQRHGHSRDFSDDSFQTIVVGIDQYEPFSFSDAEGNIIGIDVELAKEAFHRLNYKPEFKYIDWSKKKELIDSKQIDCIWSSFSMTGREDLFCWAGPYLYSQQVVMVPNDSNIHSIKDLNGKVVGVQSTTKPEDIFMSDGKNIPKIKELIVFPSKSETVASLREGGVDAVAGHITVLHRYTVQENFRFLSEPLEEVCLGVAFSKTGDTKLVKALTKTLEDMKNEGILDEIVSKYGLDPKPLVWRKRHL